MPLFEGDAARTATSNRAIEELSEFMLENELAEAPISPSRYATNEFVDGAG